MTRNLFSATLLLGAFAVPTFATAATSAFYVEQDAKTHACTVSDKKPDGKTMMDVGTKAYDSQANAQKAMANLKACAVAPAAAAPAAAAPATPAVAAGFYVAQDAKTHKCMVDDKKPDGKMTMDVGTKVYAAKANAEQAIANLKACK